MNAELLLMFTLECDRAYLHAHPERKLSADEQRRYDQALAERERGMPAQYITGHQEFWGMDLIVTPAVLIPRPETEHVIETVLHCGCGAGALARVFGAHRRRRHRIRMHRTGPGQRIAAAPKSTQPKFHPPPWKSPAPTPLATNSKAGSSSIKPTCCRASSAASLISWFPIRRTSANRKQTRCNLKSASMSRATRCLPELQDWK